MPFYISNVGGFDGDLYVKRLTTYIVDGAYITVDEYKRITFIKKMNFNKGGFSGCWFGNQFDNIDYRSTMRF